MAYNTKEKQREYMERYRKEHPEKFAEASRRYRRKHPERYRESVRRSKAKAAGQKLQDPTGNE